VIPEQVRNMFDQVNDSINGVGIEFTDAAGTRWERDPRGTRPQLTEACTPL